MSGLVRSAGLLPYRTEVGLEVLIAHPGGPYFARKDLGWWSLVKGMVKAGEDDEMAAAREFEEETGWAPPAEPWIPLGETRMRSGKVVVAWGVEYFVELEAFNPGTFTLHGRSYPEIDMVAWVTTDEAKARLSPAQWVFVDRLVEHLDLSTLKDPR